MSDLAPLKSVSKGGKTILWRIEVVEKVVASASTSSSGGCGRIVAPQQSCGGTPPQGEIVVHRGYEGGAVQVDKTVVEKGKNIGRKNETTPFQQALQDARTAWNKKIAAGYEPASASAAASATASVVAASASACGGAGGKAVSEDRSTTVFTEVPMPMLANKWNDRKGHIKFPCFIQPKYDGTRALGICGLPEGTPCLFSRQRKAYPHLEHIQAVLRTLPKGLILDGELYTQAIHFQDIVGLCKKKTIAKKDEAHHALIEFHCYDAVIEGKPYSERNALLTDLFKTKGPFTVLRLCPTETVASEAELKPAHDKYVAAGFEGLMLRNMAGPYLIAKRSNDLLKMKEFEDDEFQIVGFYEAEGAEKGCVMWRCATKGGGVFGCRPEGTRESREELFREGASHVGKMLTVRYQELTPDGIPRFPVGVGIRED